VRLDREAYICIRIRKCIKASKTIRAKNRQHIFPPKTDLIELTRGGGGGDVDVCLCPNNALLFFL
jgi:hypothetical protein